MARSLPFPLAVPAALLLSLLAAAVAPAEPWVRISLSAEDPEQQTAEWTSAEPIRFHVFLGGQSLRGGELGLVIEGGTFLQYVLDSERVWLPLPIPQPYPGTVGQVTTDCVQGPVRFGELLVQPDEPGGTVIVDVIPSERSEYAVFLNCDLGTTNGFRAWPAAVNAPAPKPHEVAGDEVVSEPLPHLAEPPAPEAGPAPKPSRGEDEPPRSDAEPE